MIEKTIFQHLKKTLKKPVFVKFPEPNPHTHEKVPSEFYLLEKTGGDYRNHIGYATFALQSYGKDVLACAEMSLKGINAMEAALTLDTVANVDSHGDYNWPDLTRKRERYQALFTITHYETE